MSTLMIQVLVLKGVSPLSDERSSGIPVSNLTHTRVPELVELRMEVRVKVDMAHLQRPVVCSLSYKSQAEAEFIQH